MTPTPNEDARVLLAFYEYQSSASSHALLLAVITWLDLKEKDRYRWPALETILFRALATRERATRQQDIEAIQSLTGKDCGNWNRAIVYAVEAITSLQKESSGKEK